MSQNNSPSQWPKAAVAVFGTIAISAASYLLKEPQVMLSMILLVWLIGYFD